MANKLLDVKDRKILCELDKNSRQSLKKIAKRVGLSRETVGYRIQRLKKKGIIKQFITVIDFSKLGLVNFGVYLKLTNITAESEKKLIKYLVEHENIVWVATIGGRFDLVIEIIAENVKMFNKIWRNILRDNKKNIISYEIAIRLGQFQFRRMHLPKSLSESVEHYDINDLKKIKIDDIDSRILSVLAANARTSNIEISYKINVPVSTVAFRIKKLVDTGIIKSFSIRIDSRKFGCMDYKALIILKTPSDEKEEKMFKYAELHPNIYYLTLCIGRWNIELEFEVDKQERYQQFLMELRDKFGDAIQDIETVNIFKEHKLNYFPIKSFSN